MVGGYNLIGKVAICEVANKGSSPFIHPCRLAELVDAMGLKPISFWSIGSIPITVITICNTILKGDIFFYIFLLFLCLV
jgi:hypothetical protein